MFIESGPVVRQYKGKDCWRTSFIEECEASGLLGVRKGDLKNVKNTPYKEGTLIYLEDAPFFNKVHIHHRICGPYRVVSTSSLPRRGKVIHEVDKKIIVYEEPLPKEGPWLNRKRERVIEGSLISFPQKASDFNYYPLRLKIEKGNSFVVKLVTHEVNCKLCSKPYDPSVFSKKKTIKNNGSVKLIKNPRKGG